MTPQPIVMPPEASVAEAQRAADMGLRGVNMTSDPQQGGAPDLASQQAAAAQIQQLAFRDLPYIPTGQFFMPMAYRRSLTGIIPGPIPFFWNVEKSA